MEEVLLCPRPLVIIILSSVNFKICIALASANPATVTIDRQTVASLERMETGPGCMIHLDNGKNL